MVHCLIFELLVMDTAVSYSEKVKMIAMTINGQAGFTDLVFEGREVAILFLSKSGRHFSVLWLI